MSDHSARPRPRRGPWWAMLLGGTALLVTALVLGLGQRTPEDFGEPARTGAAPAAAPAADAGPTGTTATGRATGAGPTGADGRTSATPARSVPLVAAEDRRPATAPEPQQVQVPVGLRIPDVDVDVDVVPVGVREDGQMEIPESGQDVGWYRYGAGPAGDEGSVVLASHVDTLAEGEGVLARLTELRAGDLVSVTLEDGRVVDYRVTGRRTVPKAELDTAALFDRSGPERLQLVTCGGPWQPEQSSYRDNVIVTAEPVTASS